LPSGTSLERDKVRTIKNLLMGSIPGLKIENISITDTNGTVYKSIESAEDSAIDMTEENDKYMKAKVQTQLDKLIGKDKYVVTVSTFLRQVPIERSSITYDPKGRAVANEQQFTEQLGDQSKDSSRLGQAASVYLPGGLTTGWKFCNKQSYGREARECNITFLKLKPLNIKNPAQSKTFQSL
jgi:flagellar M-ring protein FliF